MDLLRAVSYMSIDAARYSIKLHIVTDIMSEKMVEICSSKINTSTNPISTCASLIQIFILDLNEAYELYSY